MYSIQYSIIRNGRVLGIALSHLIHSDTGNRRRGADTRRLRNGWTTYGDISSVIPRSRVSRRMISRCLSCSKSHTRNCVHQPSTIAQSLLIPPHLYLVSHCILSKIVKLSLAEKKHTETAVGPNLNSKPAHTLTPYAVKSPSSHYSPTTSEPKVAYHSPRH